MFNSIEVRIKSDIFYAFFLILNEKQWDSSHLNFNLWAISIEGK